MITLNLLKLLEDNGFGKIDKNLFWQKLGLGKTGLYISNISVNGERGKRRVQHYEIFSISENDVEGLKKLESVAKFLRENYAINELPAVDGVCEKVRNVAIMPPSTISNVGENSQGRVVYSISGEIIY